MSEPVLDIVIPVHDRADWLGLCLYSIDTWTEVPHRVILVDNASEEEETRRLLKRSETLLQRAGGKMWLRREVNDSFSASVNAGVAAGVAPFVCVLNSDAIVTPGWAEALLEDLKDETVGLVAARTNKASGVQGSAVLQGAPLVKPGYLVFVCVAFRRAVWDTVGPLDAGTFDGWSGEDLDYSWRVEDAGFRLLVSEAAEVFHGGSRTLAVTVGDEDARARNDERYRAKLMQKWGPAAVARRSRNGPSVLVVSFSAEEWTRVDFMKSAVRFLAPLEAAGIAWSYEHVTRTGIAAARQKVADAVLEAGASAPTHVLMVDDDMTEIPEDVVARLLRRRVPVVSCLAYGRRSPHTPCIFSADERGELTYAEGAERTGLRPVGATGFGLVLIERDVFGKLATYYERTLSAIVCQVAGCRKAATCYGQYEGWACDDHCGHGNEDGRCEPVAESEVTKGIKATRRQQALQRGAVMFEANPDGGGEDLFFSARCREAGIGVFCDTDIVIGHMGAPVVVNESFRAKWRAELAAKTTPDRRVERGR